MPSNGGLIMTEWKKIIKDNHDIADSALGEIDRKDSNKNRIA